MKKRLDTTKYEYASNVPIQYSQKGFCWGCDTIIASRLVEFFFIFCYLNALQTFKERC